MAAVFILAFCFGSDFAKERGHFLAAAAGFGCLSFIITVAVDDEKVKCKLTDTRIRHSSPAADMLLASRCFLVLCLWWCLRSLSADTDVGE